MRLPHMYENVVSTRILVASIVSYGIRLGEYSFPINYPQPWAIAGEVKEPTRSG